MVHGMGALLVALCLGGVQATVDSPSPSAAYRDAARANRKFRKQYLEREPDGGDETDPYPGFALRNFSQKVDHFNFENGHAGTWDQRYLISTDAWDASKGGPIMFFTGAEGGDITLLYSYAYGYILKVAKELGALLVFMEHRFFGDSMPYGSPAGSDRPNAAGFGALSIEQGLADYADLITAVLNNRSAWDNPTISFGGSLAGTLAALIRVRYPHLIDMAWASSTPLLGYPGLVDQFAWRKQITDDFETLSPGCPDLARKGFSGIVGADIVTLGKVIPVCEKSFTWSDIQQVAWGVLESDGEFCYPPSRSGIPAHCAAMMKGAATGDGAAIFTSLVQAGAQRYWSPTGKCLNLTEYRAEDQTPDAIGWNYLASTTIVHPIGANNVTDMFPAFNWSLADTAYFAKHDFNVTPDATHVPSQFGVAHLKHFIRANSRIVFVYGLRDPWHTMGVGLTNLSDDLPVVTIADGSHCADTLVEGKSDTLPMLAGRAKVVAQIKAWIADVQLEKLELPSTGAVENPTALTLAARLPSNLL